MTYSKIDDFGVKLKKRVGEYLKYFDTAVFGETFDHICTVRTILTMLAKQISKESALTDEKILEINKRVAKEVGASISGSKKSMTAD